MMKTTALTEAQGMRIDARNRKTGRFTKNTCQCCGKPAPMDYCSHELTDCTDAEGKCWADIALVLCNKCAKATMGMTLVREYEAYKAQRRGGAR